MMTISAFFGVIVFWLISSQALESMYDTLPAVLQDFWLGVAAIVAVFAVLSWLSLRLARKTFPDGNSLKADEIKPIENIAMPTYIGMFVIALEIGGSLDLQRSSAVLILLLILWWLFERVFYFNPVWLLFGYRFYEAKTVNGNTFTVISKQKNLKGNCDFDNLRKINEYTYLESN